MKNSQKGFINIIIGVLVVAVIAGYVAWSKDLIPKDFIQKITGRQATTTTVASSASFEASDFGNVKGTSTMNTSINIEANKSNKQVSAPLIKLSATQESQMICQGGSACPNPGSVKVTLSNSSWNVGGTYRVSWTNNLDSKLYDYYYIQMGSGTSTKRLTSNPGSYGIWKVDKSKSFFDIPFGKWLADETLYNSSTRTLDEIKDILFIRLSVYNAGQTEYPYDDRPVAAGESNYFSMQGYQDPIISDPVAERELQLNNSKILTLMISNFRMGVVAVNDKYSSVEMVCKDGIINVSADNKLKLTVDKLLEAQGVSTQAEAGISCASGKNAYALQVVFKNKPVSENRNSYCVDAIGREGDDHRYLIDMSTAVCKSVLPTLPVNN